MPTIRFTRLACFGGAALLALSTTFGASLAPVHAASTHTATTRAHARYAVGVTQWTANARPIAAIHQAAREFGASDYQLMTVAGCESGYNPGAYNPSGASGLFQFMWGTFYGYSRDVNWNGWASRNISPWNALAAARVAAKMFTMGQQRQWTCAYIRGVV